MGKLSLCVPKIVINTVCRLIKFLPVKQLIAVMTSVAVAVHAVLYILRESGSGQRLELEGYALALWLRLFPYVWAITDGSKDQNTLSKRSQHYALLGVPDYWQTMSYMCCTHSTGVVYLEFRDHEEFVTRRGAYEKERSSPWTTRLLWIVCNSVVGLVMCGISNRLSLVCSTKLLLVNQRTATSFLAQQTFINRLKIMELLKMWEMLRLLGRFKLTEAGLDASGLGYDAQHPECPWGRFAPSRMWKLCFEPTFRMVVHWNRGVSMMLRCTVFERVPRVMKLFSHLLAAMVSGAAHGPTVNSMLYFGVIWWARSYTSRGIYKLRKDVPGLLGWVLAAAQVKGTSCPIPALQLTLLSG